MTEHEEVIAWRRRAIFGGIDFFVGSVHANAQHLHEHPGGVIALLKLAQGSSRGHALVYRALLGHNRSQ